MNEENGHSSSESSPNQQPQVVWERELLTRLAMSTLNEQRRARRWKIFFVLLTFIYFGIFLVLLGRIGTETIETTAGPHTAVVDVLGVIAAETPASADTIIQGLRAAFENEGTAGVILRINSPGGSPVQAGYVYDEMLRLRNKYPNIPLYAVIEDVGASGGYYIAAGAEKIYADKASIVGSIGVRMDSFGLVEAIDKLGIERRLMTSGPNKGLLDPFLPEEEGAKAHVQQMLDTIHSQFINAVKTQRGERLIANETTFSGLIWTGERSMALGLVDALGDIRYVAREVIGEKKLRNFSVQEDFFTRLSRNMGVAFATALKSNITPQLK